MNAIHAAVVQAGSMPFDSAANINKAEAKVAEAASGGAKLVVFPEASIGGYPKGCDFGARVGSRTPDGRKLFRRYFENALDVPGPETRRLGEAAKAHGVWLVIGVIEREGGTLYCTALFFSPDGMLAGKHRKVMPTAMERIIGASATALLCQSSRPGSAGSARSSAGRTTCPYFAQPCTPRAFSSTAHPRSTTAKPGL